MERPRMSERQIAQELTWLTGGKPRSVGQNPNTLPGGKDWQPAWAAVGRHEPCTRAEISQPVQSVPEPKMHGPSENTD